MVVQMINWQTEYSIPIQSFAFVLANDVPYCIFLTWRPGRESWRSFVIPNARKQHDLLTSEELRWSKDLFEEAGRLVVDISRRYYDGDDDSVLPRNIATKAAFENAVALDVAMGGSTNTVLHLLAAAREGDQVTYAEKVQEARDYAQDLQDLRDAADGGSAAGETTTEAGGEAGGTTTTTQATPTTSAGA